MILTAKKKSDAWVIYDEDKNTVAKAKIQEKSTGTYGKIIYHDNFEQDILYSPFACKNGRKKIIVFEDKTSRYSLHKSWKLDKNHKPCFYYNMRYNRSSYYGYNVFGSKKHSILYLYYQERVIAAFAINDNSPNYAEIYLSSAADIRLTIAFLISHHILAQKKNLLISEYVSEPLFSTDANFIAKVKEYCIREDIL